MAEGGREEADVASDSSEIKHMDEYHDLLELGLDTRVAAKLEEIFISGESSNL